MQTFSKMIRFFYPDAAEDVDFTLRMQDSGEVKIVFWNTEKLGNIPDLKSMHDRYMEILKKQKTLSPKTDDTDPAPWLNPPPDAAFFSQPPQIKIPVVNIDFRNGIVTQ
jgi:hypothetical protein